MAQDRVGDAPTTTERVRAARAVVCDETGSIIDASELEGALRSYGVEVGRASDGTTEYRNVPPELPLSACHLAVETGRDPAAFIADMPSGDIFPGSVE